MAATVAARFEAVDVLVNNAGSRIVKSFLEHTEEDWRRMLDVNLTGHFSQQADRAAHPKAGGGNVVNTSSSQRCMGGRTASLLCG